jgi:hypothetical protein
MRIMSTRTTLILAIAAGFAGGIISQRIALTPVFAQAPVAPAAEIRAQKFVLVDENGKARGVFGLETNGSPFVEITDAKGRVFTTRWYPTRARDFFHDPPVTPRKTTLLP